MEIALQTSGFLPLLLHPPKMENPGTIRVYCSVLLFVITRYVK